jgi:DNA-binding winged helix-turn-helix (wHTH) protein
MRLTDEAQGAVEFGRFRLLPHRRELRADGVAVELGGRAFDVLMVLTEARGTLVTKDEIMARVWPDTVVEENNLVVQISALRRALGEDRDFIRTVSGRGYRFNAEIRSSIADTGGKTGLEPEVVPDASTSPSSDLPPPVPSLIGRETPPEEGADLRAGTVGLADGLTSPKRPLRPVPWRLFGFGLALVLAASLSWVLYSRNQAAPKIRSLAVLPLESLSGDASQDYFADGMTDELITDLGQISALRVISRTSMMTYKHVHKLLPEIARELDVEARIPHSHALAGLAGGEIESGARLFPRPLTPVPNSGERVPWLREGRMDTNLLPRQSRRRGNCTAGLIVRAEQLGARAMKAGHDRSDRHARYLGDVAVADLVQLAQDDRLAQRRRERLDQAV